MDAFSRWLDQRWIARVERLPKTAGAFQDDVEYEALLRVQELWERHPESCEREIQEMMARHPQNAYPTILLAALVAGRSVNEAQTLIERANLQPECLIFVRTNPVSDALVVGNLRNLRRLAVPLLEAGHETTELRKIFVRIALAEPHCWLVMLVGAASLRQILMDEFSHAHKAGSKAACAAARARIKLHRQWINPILRRTERNMLMREWDSIRLRSLAELTPLQWKQWAKQELRDPEALARINRINELDYRLERQQVLEVAGRIPPSHA